MARSCRVDTQAPVKSLRMTDARESIISRVTRFSIMSRSIRSSLAREVNNNDHLEMDKQKDLTTLTSFPSHRC